MSLERNKTAESLSIPDAQACYAYMVECSDKSLYCGWTNNLKKRIKAHNSGEGAKYTKGRRPVRLVYYEILENKSMALVREAQLKKLDRKAKLELIMQREYT